VPAPTQALLPLLAGLLAAAAQAVLAPEAGLSAAAVLGVKAALGCWCAVALGSAAAATAVGRRDAAAVPPAAPAAPGHPATGVPSGRGPDLGGLLPLAWRAGTGHVIAAGAVALCLVFGLVWRNPGRLTVNVAGFVLTCVALAWVVGRRGGPGAARRAVLAVAVLALVASLADVRRPLPVLDAAAGSPYRWSVGWPVEGWVLRHEIRPEPLLEAEPKVLIVPLAQAYAGPAQAFVRLNGQELGTARLVDGQRLEVALPAPLVAGQRTLSFELRLSPADPRLRLIGHRWGQGATLGPAASSYFDGTRWRTGTFDDATGRPRDGIYVLLLTHPQD
jgi:hypothetical protein